LFRALLSAPDFLRVKNRLLAVVLLAYSLSACTPIMDAVVDTARTVAPGKKLDTSKLNPQFSYIRVTVGRQVAFFALGFFDKDRHGQVEVWYSGQKETLRLQDGRLIGVVGLATEWREVVLPDLPSWSSLAQRKDPLNWVRIRDVMPGYRFGIRDELMLQRIPAPAKSELLHLDPSELTWFEERFEKESKAGSATLPPARYAVDLRDGIEFVVYGEQCLAADFCFTWQRWPYHKQEAGK
jgi:hypothetical protein